MSSNRVKVSHGKSRLKRISTIIAIVLVLLLTGTLVSIPYMVMPMFLGQRFEQTQYDSAHYGIESKRITLTTQDGLSIAAWRTRAGSPKGTVIILSGIENPSVTAFFGYAKMLADNGWDAMLIEMRARSQSQGDEIGLGMTEWLDVKAAVDFINADTGVGGLPIVAMGTSMGAGTAIIAAGELDGIDAVISISAFSSWANMFAEYMQMAGIPKIIGILDKPFVNMYLGFHFGFGSVKYTPVNGIAKLGERPILLMHSTEDSQVPYSEFESLLRAADKHSIDVTTFIREGNEHFICYEEYFDEPSRDEQFSASILNFLNANFP